MWGLTGELGRELFVAGQVLTPEYLHVLLNQFRQSLQFEQVEQWSPGIAQLALEHGKALHRTSRYSPA